MAVTENTNQPIVIDNGSGIVKAGFAGQDYPSGTKKNLINPAYFPSIIGRPKHQRIMAGAVEGDQFIGTKCQDLRGLLSISRPMEHGSLLFNLSKGFPPFKN